MARWIRLILLWVGISLAIVVIFFVGVVFWAKSGLNSGRYSSVRMGEPLATAHQRAVTSFVESVGFGPSRFRKAKF